jgi:prevent-host-death family protein
MVISVSVAELKARLSHYLRMVQAGRDVIVTDRGVPVARLCPVGPAFPDARTTALCRAGLARPSRQALPPDFWERPRPADPEGRALAALLEERAEGLGKISTAADNNGSNAPWRPPDRSTSG